MKALKITLTAAALSVSLCAMATPTPPSTMQLNVQNNTGTALTYNSNPGVPACTVSQPTIAGQGTTQVTVTYPSSTPCAVSYSTSSITRPQVHFVILTPGFSTGVLTCPLNAGVCIGNQLGPGVSGRFDGHIIKACTAQECYTKYLSFAVRESHTLVLDSSY